PRSIVPAVAPWHRPHCRRSAEHCAFTPGSAMVIKPPGKPVGGKVATPLDKSDVSRYIDKPLGWPVRVVRMASRKAFSQPAVEGFRSLGQERSTPTSSSGVRVRSFGCTLKTEQRKAKSECGRLLSCPSGRVEVV